MVRRADKLMSSAKIDELLSMAYNGRLATVGQHGAPYICPLLYVWKTGHAWPAVLRPRVGRT
jgi:nitroimidazol reductase NimA-like FMN-containing flavoprotein (pyridoxamine 5'-phosphate oxidase superfamily)